MTNRLSHVNASKIKITENCVKIIAKHIHRTSENNIQTAVTWVKGVGSITAVSKYTDDTVL
jgi:hypothetical protein